MNNEIRIKNSQEFENIIKSGNKKRNFYFVIYYKERKNDFSRFGVTLSKNFGNAVKRNYYKRVLREIIRNNQKKFKKSYDYIIIMKKNCDNLNYQIIEEKLIDLL